MRVKQARNRDQQAFLSALSKLTLIHVADGNDRQVDFAEFWNQVVMHLATHPNVGHGDLLLDGGHAKMSLGKMAGAPMPMAAADLTKRRRDRL